MPAGNKGLTRAGLAALAAGLLLSGPQAAGVGSADAGEDNSQAPAATDTSPRAGTAGRAEGRSRGATPARARGTVRSAGSGNSEDAAPAAARNARTRLRGIPSASPQPAAARMPASKALLAPVARPADKAAIATADEAAPSGPAAQTPAGPSASPTAAAAAIPASTAAPARALARPAAVGNVNRAAVRVLDNVANWLATLPNQSVSDLLGGALIQWRRNLFDQAPIASPVQETTTSQGHVLGTLGAIDPENDPISYRVVTGPEFGSVTVSADGHYTYTPGEQYTGSDSFTVRVADTNGGFNLFNPTGRRSSDVTVQVGSQAATDPFCANNLSDASLLLRNTAATITVSKRSGKLLGSIALNIPDDTPLVWLDDHGRTGSISAANVAAHWNGIQSAGNVMLGIDYTLGDGTDATMILRSVQATSTGSGQYVFSGVLAPDVPDGAGVNSFWDVVGSEFKVSYENFLDKNGIHAAGFRTCTQDVNAAAVYLDTYSVYDYEKALAGTDPGTPISDPGASPGGAATRFQRLAANATATPGVNVTAMLPLGSSLVVGQSDGSVEMWDGQSFNQLHLPGPWGGPYDTPPPASPVRAIISYQSGFVAGLANGAVEQWDGKQWTELLSYASLPDSQVLTAMLPYQSGFVVGLGGPSPTVKQWTGTEWTKLAGYDTTADWGSAVSSMLAYKSGFAVGLDNGAVQQWDGTAWQELQAQTGAKVTVMARDNGDLVVGRSDGAVQRWDGSTWEQLSGSGIGVTTMLVDPLGKLTVGRADGSLQRDVVDPSCESNCRSRLTVELSSGGVTYGGTYVGNTLSAGQQLNVGDWLASPNGAYTLGLQQDGNLVLKARGQTVWASGSYGKNVDRALLQSDGNFVLYAGSTAVWSSDTPGQQNVQLSVQDDRNAVIYSGANAVWNSDTYTADAPPTAYAVTSLLGYGDTLVVSFADGSVKQGLYKAGTSLRWTDLSASGTAGVTAMAPYSVAPSTTGSDGFFVGLDNGVIKRYSKWANHWDEMRSLPDPGSFSEQTLRDAVQFAQGGGQAASASDPLFGMLNGFQPKCMSDNSCGTGSIYGFNLSKAPTSLASANLPFSGAGQSVDLSYDLGTTGYGYVFVPGGVWKKLDPDNYSFGALLGVTTGPSLTLNLGNGCDQDTCTLTAVERSLASYSWSTPPSPYGNITLTADVTAKLDVVLGMPPGFTKNKLTASAYLTGGVVLAYNTPTSYWNAGWNYYIDKNVDDFLNLTSVSIVPTITPSITGSWGYTVSNVPILGTVSLASVGLTYSNPVDLTLSKVANQPLSLTIGSSGNLDFSAGFVPTLTDSLTYKTTFPLYSVRTPNLLSA